MTPSQQVTTTDIAEERRFIEDVLQAESDAIRHVLSQLDSQVHKAVDLIEACEGHVIASGIGKSGLIAMKISATMASLGQPSHFLHPTEAVHGDLGRVKRGDVVLALSYSGCTDELVNLASLLRPDHIPIIGMSRSSDSPLGRLSDVHLSVGEIAEACSGTHAPTSSTTAMLALGDALALAVSRRRNFNADDFHKLHPGGSLGTGLRPITQVLRFRVGGERQLPIVKESQVLVDALQEAEVPRRPGAMLVVDIKGSLCGIFTDGDLRRLTLHKNTEALNRPISEVMTRNPQSLPHTALVRDAVQLVRDHRQDEIPVVDDEGKPIGLLDVQDLIALKVIQD